MSEKTVTAFDGFLKKYVYLSLMFGRICTASFIMDALQPKMPTFWAIVFGIFITLFFEWNVREVCKNG